MAGLLSGVLPAAMSGAESLRRNLLDFVRDPMARIERSVGQTKDYERELGDLYRQGYDAQGNIINQDAANAFNTAMANMASNMSNVAGATVWHGSPAKFDRFDPAKIGSGEGAQAYGYGHYLAESPEVAKVYQQATSKDKFLTPQGFFDPSSLEHLNVKAEVRKGNLDKAIDIAKKYSQHDADYPETAAKAARDLSKLQAVKTAGGIQENTGNFYKVDLPDNQIAKMLDFDAELGKQTPEVQALAKQYGLNMDDLGGDLVAAMNAKLPQGAEAMRQAGVPGIKYFDAQSRGGKQADTRNFVVFPKNEGLLNILERNNEPVVRGGIL